MRFSFAELSMVSNREKQSTKAEADFKKVKKREDDGGKKRRWCWSYSREKRRKEIKRGKQEVLPERQALTLTWH